MRLLLAAVIGLCAGAILAILLFYGLTFAHAVV